MTDRRREVDELMLDVSRGSRAAFSELYDQVAGSVFGLARRIVRDPSISDEVTHDVMVEVWSKATNWNAEHGSAKAWIATDARRRAVDRVRSEQSARNHLERHSAELSPAAVVVSEAVIEEDERGRVRSVLVGLSEVQREVIELAYYLGHTQQEIAGLLEVPLGTVKTRMRDGMIRLKTRMGDI
ncbi:MAG: sigma-70 family RNA polymerase sigma factor [Acidimicrobiia bacterium]|nr:sigma-70 family RNA polymerase sigma factor [Acidimicrobiia bacterium]MDH3462622.1 sigma-70 family RNA polymerase sigma factor [Acidimicrobiia bacterium]